MKITQTAQKIKGNFAMDVSVDVHKDTLYRKAAQLQLFELHNKSGESRPEMTASEL